MKFYIGLVYFYICFSFKRLCARVGEICRHKGRERREEEGDEIGMKRDEESGQRSKE